jgi:microcystin-dependent protein
MTLFNFVPSGTILPFGGVTAPAGWLLCDGSAVSRTVYANLYSAIGSVWGTGDGSSTFHLPDLRGRFIRGRDGGVARDPDRTTRTAANSGGNTGDNVGSVQDNATAKNGLSASSGTHSADHAHYTTTGGVSANHYHGISGDGYNTLPRANDYNWNSMYNAGGVVPIDDSWTTVQTAPNHSHGGGTGWISSDHSHGGWSGGVNTNHTHGITVGNGDNETRPKNANVNYIIKI